MSTAPRRPRPPARRRRPLPPVLRDWRAYAGLAAIVAAIAIVLGAFGGGEDGEAGPPATDAARLVPAGALAYLHVSTDEDRAGVRRALALLGRFPAQATLRRQLTGLLRPGDDEAPLDVGRDVAPWLGDEAALAITWGRGTTAGSLMLLAVAEDDLADARAFLARGAGTPRRSTHRGVALTTYRNGTVTAYVEGFLAIGQRASVRAAVELASAGGDGAPRGSLAADAVYRRASAGAPEERVAEVYATVDGVRRLLAPQPGLLGLAGALLDQRGLRGTSLALTAGEDRARVRVHAVLDPRQRTPAPRFRPTLTDSVPSDAVAYAGFAGLERAGPALLGISGLAGLGDTNELLTEAGRVLREGGVDVARDVLPLFGQEVAVVAVPGADGGPPTLALLARTSDARRTRAALRRLEPALARLFAPAGGAAPPWADARAGDTPLRRLAPAEGIELDYAVIGDTVAVATSGAAIAAVAGPRETIADNPSYRATVADSTADLTSVVFFDFGQLLRSLEEMGLTGGPGGDGAVSDLERVRAVGLASTSEETQSTAELTLEIP